MENHSEISTDDTLIEKISIPQSLSYLFNNILHRQCRINQHIRRIRIEIRSNLHLGANAEFFRNQVVPDLWFGH